MTGSGGGSPENGFRPPDKFSSTMLPKLDSILVDLCDVDIAHPLANILSEALLSAREVLSCWSNHKLHSVAVSSILQRQHDILRSLQQYANEIPHSMEGKVEMLGHAFIKGQNLDEERTNGPNGSGFTQVSVYTQLHSLHLLTSFGAHHTMDLNDIVSIQLMRDDPCQFKIELLPRQLPSEGDEDEAEESPVPQIYVFRVMDEDEREKWVHFFERYAEMYHKEKLFSSMNLTKRLRTTLQLYDKSTLTQRTDEDFLFILNPPRKIDGDSLHTTKQRTIEQSYDVRAGASHKRTIKVVITEDTKTMYFYKQYTDESKKKKNKAHMTFSNDDLLDYRPRADLLQFDLAFCHQQETLYNRTFTFANADEWKRFYDTFLLFIGFQPTFDPILDFKHNAFLTKLTDPNFTPNKVTRVSPPASGKLGGRFVQSKVLRNSSSPQRRRASIAFGAPPIPGVPHFNRAKTSELKSSTNPAKTNSTSKTNSPPNSSSTPRAGAPTPLRVAPPPPQMGSITLLSPSPKNESDGDQATSPTANTPTVPLAKKKQRKMSIARPPPPPPPAGADEEKTDTNNTNNNTAKKEGVSEANGSTEGGPHRPTDTRTAEMPEGILSSSGRKKPKRRLVMNTTRGSVTSPVNVKGGMSSKKIQRNTVKFEGFEDLAEGTSGRGLLARQSTRGSALNLLPCDVGWPPQVDVNLDSLISDIREMCPKNKHCASLHAYNSMIGADQSPKCQKLHKLQMVVLSLYNVTMEESESKPSDCIYKAGEKTDENKCTCRKKAGSCHLEFLSVFVRCQGVQVLESVLDQTEDHITVNWCLKGLFRAISLSSLIEGCKSYKAKKHSSVRKPFEFDEYIKQIDFKSEGFLSRELVSVLLNLITGSVNLGMNQEVKTPEVMSKAIYPESVPACKALVMAGEKADDRTVWKLALESFLLLFDDTAVGRSNSLLLFDNARDVWQNWMFPLLLFVPDDHNLDDHNLPHTSDERFIFTMGITSNFHFHTLQTKQDKLAENSVIYQSVHLMKNGDYHIWTNMNSSLVRMMLMSLMSKIGNRARSYSDNFCFDTPDAPYWMNFFNLLCVCEEYIFFSPTQSANSDASDNVAEMGLHFDDSELSGPRDLPLVQQIITTMELLKLAKRAPPSLVRQATRTALEFTQFDRNDVCMESGEKVLKKQAALELGFWCQVNEALKQMNYDKSSNKDDKDLPPVRQSMVIPTPSTPTSLEKTRKSFFGKSSSNKSKNKNKSRGSSANLFSGLGGIDEDDAPHDIDDVIANLTNILKQRPYARRRAKKLKSGTIRIPRPPVPQAIGKKTMKWEVMQANKFNKNSTRLCELNLETQLLCLFKPNVKQPQKEVKGTMISNCTTNDKDNSLVITYFANGRLLRSKEDLRLIFQSAFERERMYRTLREHFIDDSSESSNSSYTPQPLPISPETQELVDKLPVRELAAELHEAWNFSKRAAGWTYGPKRDNEKKIHPQLLHFEKLPKEDQMYDLEMANFTVAGIYELGYTIAETGPMSDALQILVEFLAENAHESWADSKAKKGFKWGEKTDADAKTHVLMRPYAAMTEDEKDMDRDAAQTILETFVKMGLKIRKVPKPHSRSST